MVGLKGIALAVDAVLLTAAGAIGAVVIAIMTHGQPSTPAGLIAARAAIADDPLDVDALRQLGLTLERFEKSDAADAVFGFIATRTWRDEPSETWLFRHRLAQGRYDEAFEQADALLRRDIDDGLRNRLAAILVLSATDADAREALIDRLANAPWWRPSFLRQLGANGDPAAVRAVLVALRAGPTPPKPDEYATFINRRVTNGAYAEALADWRALQTHPATARGAVRDGDFRTDPDGTPFRWNAIEGVGVSGETVGGLSIDYDGYSLPTLPRQLLVLQPGRYRLAWRERRTAGPAGRILWRVRCAEGGAALARSLAADDRRDLAFNVPVSGCTGQWLELVAEPGERRESVQIAYSQVRIEVVL